MPLDDARRPFLDDERTRLKPPPPQDARYPLGSGHVIDPEPLPEAFRPGALVIVAGGAKAR